MPKASPVSPFIPKNAKPTNAPASFNPVGAIGGLLGKAFSAAQSASQKSPLAQALGGSQTESPNVFGNTQSPISPFGIRAASPTANVSTTAPILAKSQKAPADQQPVTPPTVTPPAQAPTAQTVGATAPVFSSSGGAIIPQSPAAPGTPGSATNLGPQNGGTPATPQAGTYAQTPSGAFVDPATGQMLGGAPQQAQGPTFPGLIGQLITQGNQYQPEIQKTSQNIQDLRTQLATQQAGIGTGGLTLPVAQGREQVLGQTEAAQETAQQGMLANLLKGQELSQGALSSAASATQPQLGQYGQTYYLPLGGAQSGGAAGVQPSDPFYSTLQTYAQGIANNSISPSQVPATISGNPVLQAQVFQMAQQVNPNFNATQWQANTAAQQQALQQNVSQGYQLQNSVNSANQVLGSLQNFYNQLSPLQTAGIPLTNDLAQTIGQFLGSGTVSQYHTALTDARNQVLSVLASTGMTATDAQGAVQRFLPDGMTPAQLNANIAALQTFMGQRVSAFTQPSGAPQYGGGTSGGATSNMTGSLYAF